MRTLIPCDAAALLRLNGEWLEPLAVDGLSGDTLGRRFRIKEHPRFQALMESFGPTRFPADCDLPDPYDGLIDGLSGHLEVHDCMGCPLFVVDKPWGVLTLDALEPERFSTIDLDALQAFASLAAATVNVAERIHRLAVRAENEHQLAEVYRVAAQQSPRPWIGQSAQHKQLLGEIDIVGNSDLTVLINGETGVGKELVAHALHAASARATKPLISLNCAALPETLVESELFGHVRGAFSGAVNDRRGKFELADGGTLFLDEVGELSQAVQAKLLRVLQSGQLQRLGSDREHHVDVRVIAATNRDLAEEVRSGRFRADFYHRLSVYPLKVPALRERGHDVLLLSGFFLEENRSRLGLNSLRLSASAQAALMAYDWPGNVRELEHVIGRSALKALAKCDKRPRILSLSAADLDLPNAVVAEVSVKSLDHAPISVEDFPTQDLRQAVANYERLLIENSLRRHQNNWAATARALGVDRANLSRMAKRLGLRS
jgi:anaerobic nitric oxide reductase transcription regulator